VILPEHDDLPTLTVDFTAINPGLIDRLVPEIGTLSVLYDKVGRYVPEGMTLRNHRCATISYSTQNWPSVKRQFVR
jgi:hypothetical protein